MEQGPAGGKDSFMFTAIWLMKRKAGVDPARFRELYEKHALLGQKYLGHLMVGYRRFYVTEAAFGGDARDPNSGFGVKPWSHDAIAEWVFKSEADFSTGMQVFADPDVSQEFFLEEEMFLDRSATVMIKSDGVDTGTGDGFGALALAKRTS
jgi:hypothetical protein